MQTTEIIIVVSLWSIIQIWHSVLSCSTRRLLHICVHRHTESVWALWGTVCFLWGAVLTFWGTVCTLKGTVCTLKGTVCTHWGTTCSLWRSYMYIWIDYWNLYSSELITLLKYIHLTVSILNWSLGFNCRNGEEISRICQETDQNKKIKKEKQVLQTEIGRITSHCADFSAVWSYCDMYTKYIWLTSTAL